MADRKKGIRISYHIDDINLTQMLRGCKELSGAEVEKVSGVAVEQEVVVSLLKTLTWP